MVTRVWTDHDQILKRCWKHFASCAWPARPAGTACRAAAPFRLRASPRRCRRIHRPRPRIQARAVRYQRRDAAEKGGRRHCGAPARLRPARRGARGRRAAAAAAGRLVTPLAGHGAPATAGGGPTAAEPPRQLFPPPAAPAAPPSGAAGSGQHWRKSDGPPRARGAAGARPAGGPGAGEMLVTITN